MTELNFDRSMLYTGEHVFIGKEASPDLKARAAGQLQRYLDAGIGRATHALETIERDAPTDTVLSTRVLAVEPSASGLDLVIKPPAKPGITIDDILEQHDQRRALKARLAKAERRAQRRCGLAYTLREWRDAMRSAATIEAREA